MSSLLLLDQQISAFLYWSEASGFWQSTISYLASGVVYLIPIVLLVMFFRSYADRLVSTKIFLAAVLAWQGMTNLLGDYLYGVHQFRDRPFAKNGLQELLFERPEKAFPSDHAAVIAVVVLGFFAYRYPKLGYFFLVAGLLSSLARVVIGFHWFGDVVAGWLVGALAVGAIRVLDRPITNAIEWIIGRFSKDYGRKTA